jgi:hypothetical protein
MYRVVHTDIEKQQNACNYDGRGKTLSPHTYMLDTVIFNSSGNGAGLTHN